MYMDVEDKIEGEFVKFENLNSDSLNRVRPRKCVRRWKCDVAYKHRADPCCVYVYLCPCRAVSLSLSVCLSVCVGVE